MTTRIDTTDPKRIEYSRPDRDYSAWYDGEFIGAYPTYHAAELALDDHALYLAEQGLDRTATELDGGSGSGRELAFCEVCGAPGTTTDPDADYICPDCLATTATAGPDSPCAASIAAP